MRECEFLSEVLVTPTTQAQVQFGQSLGILDEHSIAAGGCHDS